MKPFPNSTQIIGFAGLASHEETTVDLVQRTYTHRLSRVREIRDVHFANIVFLDPSSRAGQEALQRTDTYLIAVQDRRDHELEDVDATLHRPLCPRAVVESLNAIDRLPQATPQSESTSEKKTGELADIFRDILTDQANPQPIALSESGKTWLVIEPGRDRIRGALTLLTSDRFMSRDSQCFEKVSPYQASKLFEHDEEAPLYRSLWTLAHELGGRRKLFNDNANPLFRFKRWPNLSEAGISREFLRGLSLLRHGNFDVRQACLKTGLAEDDVMVLLNGAWLTGELALDTEAGQPAVKQAPRLTGVNASVLARIRSRLSGA